MDGSAPDTQHAALREALDELAARGTRALQRRARQEGHHRGLATGAWLLLVGPAAVLFIQLMQALVGAPVWDPSAPWLIVAVLLPWALGAIVSASRAAQTPVPRASAIALFDGAADARERLVAADELLRSGVQGAFVDAALEDARWFAKPATRVDVPELAPDLSRTGPEHRRMLGCAGAGVLIALVAAILGDAPSEADAGDVFVVPGTQVADVAQPPPERGDGTSRPEERDAPEPQDALPPSEAGEATAATKPSALPDEAKRKEGVGGSGRSSRAETSRGGSEARGAPTNQGQESKKPATKKPLKPEKKKKRSKKDFKKPPKAKQAAGEESGSTTGRGSSRGSNKNPVTSDWTSKDQVTTDEDEEIEDDEDVEDETSDSEARGGVQPNLRDRKPPVSRDLGIGFGNQPNPNANGRGGPSQQKKSRGTASLVLGVPIPDRVKGQPNPGKTKVTQERVEPRREKAGTEQARPRTPRSGPSTVLAQPEMTAWLRELVRTYFLDLRNKESNTR